MSGEHTVFDSRRSNRVDEDDPVLPAIVPPTNNETVPADTINTSSMIRPTWPPKHWRSGAGKS